MVGRTFTFRSTSVDKTGKNMQFTVVRSSIVAVYRNYYGDMVVILSAPWDSTPHFYPTGDSQVAHMSYEHTVLVHASDAFALLRWWEETE